MKIISRIFYGVKEFVSLIVVTWCIVWGLLTLYEALTLLFPTSTPRLDGLKPNRVEGVLMWVGIRPKQLIYSSGDSPIGTSSFSNLRSGVVFITTHLKVGEVYLKDGCFIGIINRVPNEVDGQVWGSELHFLAPTWLLILQDQGLNVNTLVEEDQLLVRFASQLGCPRHLVKILRFP
jgi:hypothetical protein